jgi:hypothetical protein
MNLGHVLGVVAVAGTVVLFGLAVTEDDDPDSITAGPSVVLAPTDTSDTSVAPSAIPTTDAVATTEVIATTEPAPDTQPTTEPATEPTDPPSTTDAPARTSPTNPSPSTTVATLPESRRPAVALRVVNAGADAGAARFVSGVLEEAGFEPLAPQDAADNVGGTVILHAPGREAEAATVNTVILTDRVIAAPAGDANWAAFGGGVDVLVLLGQR